MSTAAALSPLDFIAALPLLIWLYLLCARGGFWRLPARPQAPPQQSSPQSSQLSQQSSHRPSLSAPSVVAVIPARNEADSIGATVRSLLAQRYDGALHLIVVDDGSTDGTAQAAEAAAQSFAAQAASASGTSQLTILTGSAPPAGWTGKLWALAQGVESAVQRAPDFLLFTDADIRHAPDSVAQLVACAQIGQRDLVSQMVKLSVDTAAERWLIPAFVFFFLKLYPPRWIASPRSRTAGAAGGCVLIRPQALQRIGGVQTLRAQIIDDCALARAVKRSGGRLWLGLTHTTCSLRRYGSCAEIRNMIARTAFNQLHHSYLLLAATLLGLALTYCLPPLLLLSHQPLAIGFGAAAWALMSLCYLPMVRFYGVSSAWSLSLPAIAAFYGVATLQSAVQYRLGRGGAWKGRAQDLKV